MPQDFQNDGFGWYCRHCAKDTAEDASKKSRLIHEGEAETKVPAFSTSGLAKWADPAQTTLTCPRCGISELIEIQ